MRLSKETLLAKVAKQREMNKVAFQPPAAGGAPPPAGPPPGAPPMDPAAAGGAPPAGAPPMDPAAAGGAPPMDPAAGGAPPPGAPPAGPGGAPMDPQMMEMLMQALQDPQVIAMLEQQGITIDPNQGPIDQATGQVVPPEAIMQLLQTMPPPEAGGAPPAGAPPMDPAAAGGAPPPAGPDEETGARLEQLEIIIGGLCQQLGIDPEQLLQGSEGAGEAGVMEEGLTDEAMGAQGAPPPAPEDMPPPPMENMPTPPEAIPKMAEQSDERELSKKAGESIKAMRVVDPTVRIRNVIQQIKGSR